MLPMTALLEYCLTVGQHTKAISGQPVRAVEYNIHKDFFTIMHTNFHEEYLTSEGSGVQYT